MIGRIAFWLLVPGLLVTVVELGVLLNTAAGPQTYDRPDRVAALVIFTFVLVLLASMTVQAVLIVRRPQSLTSRQLPTSIAVLQLALSAVLAVWVTLLARLPLGALSAPFGLAIIGLSIALFVLIISWRPDPSEAATEVILPTALRVALWAFSLLALVALMYAVASAYTPALDPGSNRATVVFLALGLPLSLLVMPIAIAALLGGYTIAISVVAVVPVLANLAVVLLLLLPSTRVRLVNRFFRLGKVREHRLAAAKAQLT